MADTADPFGEALARRISRRDALKVVAAASVAVGPGARLLSALDEDALAAGHALAPATRVTLPSSFSPMDPAASTNGGTINLMFYVYETLYRSMVSQPTTFVPSLAIGAPIKLSPTKYRVRIRRGGRFHSGEPLTAADVVFSFQRMKRFGDASFLGKYLVNFKGIRAVGTDAVEITLHEPTALLRERLATIRVLSRKAVRGANSKKVLTYQPVGSGPFRVTNAEPSTRAIMTRFGGYRGPLNAAFPQRGLDWSVVTDPTAAVSGLQSGRFDAISAAPHSAVDALRRNRALRVASPTGTLIMGFLLNAGKPPFDDPRVRQAIMYGLDRAAIIKAAYYGNAVVAHSMVPTANADYTRPSTIYTRDVAKARSLLAAAGHANGLSFELMAGTNIAGSVASAQIMQQQLLEIGVRVTLRQGDLLGLYTDVTNGKYEALFAPSTPAVLGSADAEFTYRWLYYGAFATEFVFWKDPKQKQVERLLDDAVIAPSFAAYKRTMAQVINIVAAEGPFVPVIHVNTVVAWNPKTCLAITPAHMGNIFLGKSL